MHVLPLGRYSPTTYKNIIWCKDCEYLQDGLENIGFCKLHKIIVGKFTGYCYEIAD